jgi:toxin ParE1/3/4
MNSFVLTPLASRDLNEIWEYLAEENIDVADRMLSAIEQAIARLTEQPGIGHLREDLSDSRQRFFLVHSYLIVYRTATKPLQVIRVLHAARDVQTILDLPPEGL